MVFSPEVSVWKLEGVPEQVEWAGIMGTVTRTSMESKLPCALYLGDRDCSRQGRKDVKKQIISGVTKRNFGSTLANTQIERKININITRGQYKRKSSTQ